MLQFTKQIKEEWLKKLKSGDYIQAFRTFKGSDIEGKESRCCLAVLDTCLPENSDLWQMLRKIDNNTSLTLIETNDNGDYIATGKTDYSNVIPLIEQLPTVD